MSDLQLQLPYSQPFDEWLDLQSTDAKVIYVVEKNGRQLKGEISYGVPLPQARNDIIEALDQWVAEGYEVIGVTWFTWETYATQYQNLIYTPDPPE